MSYEDRIKAFWDMAEEKQLSSLARLLALGMLELWRRRGFTAGCGLSNYELANVIGTNEKTVRRLRTELIDAGFIWCSSKKGSLPVYYFDEEDVPERLKEKAKKVEEQKPLPEELPKPKPRPKPKVEADLWSQSRRTKAEQKKNDKANEDLQKQEKKEFVPPTLSECVGIFLRNGGTRKDAQLFYDYFNSQDWYKSNGKTRVTNVESAINYWLNSKSDERSTDKDNNRAGSQREERNKRLREELLARYGQI